MSSSDYWPVAQHIRERKTDGASAIKVSLAPYFMLALALIGVADAFYDSYAIYTGQLLWCPPPIDGCNIVANSSYARVLDMPLGYFGFVYYLYMFGLAALLAFEPFSRSLRWGSLLYAANRRHLLHLLHVYSIHVHPRVLHLLSDFRGLDVSSFHCGTLARQRGAQCGQRR
jgi:uncharacterized membrane protein